MKPPLLDMVAFDVTSLLQKKYWSHVPSRSASLTIGTIFYPLIVAQRACCIVFLAFDAVNLFLEFGTEIV